MQFVFAYPIAKLLDWLLGNEHGVFYRRAGFCFALLMAELKELVQLHGDVEQGGLTKDEVTIIKGALDLQQKTAATVMTDLAHVFSINVNTHLDREVMTHIVQAGHSRLPVYRDNPKDIVGVLIVKSLILLDPDDRTPVNQVKINNIPYVPSDTNLFDMLNRFQEGNSHMAVVFDVKDSNKKPIGIITLEDVIEELIQEEIIDETDVFVDVRTRMEVVRALNTVVNVVTNQRNLESQAINVRDNSSTVQSTNTAINRPSLNISRFSTKGYVFSTPKDAEKEKKHGSLRESKSLEDSRISRHADISRRRSGGDVKESSAVIQVENDGQ